MRTAPAFLAGATIVAALARSVLGGNGTILQSFPGGSGPGYKASPDTTGAVGPNHVVDFEDSWFMVHDKATGQVVLQLTMSNFWAWVQPGNTFVLLAPNDPRMLYDPLSGRWFASCADDTQHKLYLAVSTSSDPTQPWKGVLTPFQSPDFEFRMGVDKNGFYACWCNYQSDFHIEMDGCAIPIADMIAPGGPNLSHTNMFTNFELESFPASDWNANKTLADPEIFLNKEFPSNTTTGAEVQLCLYKINWSSPTVAGISAVQYIPFSKTYYGPNSASGNNTAQQPAPGGPIRADEGRRTIGVFAYGGRVLGCNGAKSAISARTGILWYDVRVSDGALLQEGFVDDTNCDYTHPSLAVDGAGNIGIGCTRTSTNEYPSVYIMMHAAADPASTTRPPVRAVAGTAYYTGSGSPPFAWGNYSTTCIDPADSTRLWTYQEYANSTTIGVWSTAWASFQLSLLQVPVITSAQTATATVGMPFSYVICGKNSPTNYAAMPLPAGLGVDAISGVISGTPVSAGTNLIVISAGSSNGMGGAVLQLVINPAGTTQIETYPGPGAGAYLSALYTVDVSDGTNWHSSYTYQYSRSSVMTPWHNGASPSLHFTTFGTIGPVNVRIGKTGGGVTNLSISPISKNISSAVSGGQGILTLSPNDKLWVTVNGDDTNPLFIFADPPKPAVPNGATYFGPGVTNIASGAVTNHYQARNNEVIYLDGGAWVRGNINVIGTTNVSIMGPGVLSGDLWTSETVQALAFNQTMAYCMVTGDSASGNNGGCSVQGVTLVASPTYNLRYVYRATGVKLLSPWYWSTDGFYALHTDQCFAFVGDNVFFPLWYLGGSENVTIANSFGANNNNGLFCGGYWGFPTNVAWAAMANNIDLRSYSGAGGVFQTWVDNTNSAYGFYNHTYQNIRVEGNLANGPLMELENYVYPWATAGSASAPVPPLGNAYNFTFQNISLQGTQSMLSQIYGYDATDGFHNVSLQDVTINGTRVTAANAAGYFATNAFVSGVTFSTAGNMTISASTTVGGLISPRGQVAASPGTGQTFIMTPTPGCVISNVVVDGVSHGALSSYNFTNINANHTIAAAFAAAGSGATNSNSVVLTVVSPYGTPFPGTITISSNTFVSETINSPVVNGATQQICAGGSVLGNAFTPVSLTNVTVTLTNNATLTWTWLTQYGLATMTNGDGGVTGGGWYTAGGNAVVIATPATDWIFTGWTGQTNGCAISGAQLTAPMTGAVTISANFTPLLAPLGTPEWWLAQYGWTNNFAFAETGLDPNGVAVWKDYLTGTNPTNPLSGPLYNIVPYAESFENLGGWGGVYTNVAGAMGWVSGAGDQSRLTNGLHTLPASAPPLPNATHTNILRLAVTSGVLSNSFGAGFDMGSAITYVDLAMQFAVTPQPPQTYGAADTGIKAGVYVDAATNLAVYHGLAAADGTWTGNTVHATAWLDTNAWHRLTVVLDATLTGNTSRVAMFQVRIDGAPVASAAAYPDGWKAQLNSTGLLPPTSPGGTWFRAATAGADARTLKALCFEGAGGADDVVVTTADPFVAAGGATVLMLR